MQKPGILILGFALLCSALQGLSTSGGAHLVKPAPTQINGAECYSGAGKYAGDVAFGFPVRGMNAGLSFTIGPLRDGMSPGQENNRPYSGPGKYTKIGINGKAANGKRFFGYGAVTVNADEQTGSFQLDNGSASGTWDCGHKLKR